MGGTIAGIFVTMAAAAVLAYSMVVQRYALIYETNAANKRVPLLPKLERCRVPRFVGWLMGLLLYGVASGLKVVGFNLGPFTVLASVFTTLLVFNLGFARWLLQETITRDKVASCGLVLLGAVVSTAGTPSGVPTSFSTPARGRALGPPTSPSSARPACYAHTRLSPPTHRRSAGRHRRAVAAGGGAYLIAALAVIVRRARLISA